MPITNEVAAKMRPTETSVKQSILQFLRGDSNWYTAKEIAKGIEMQYEDPIYVPTNMLFGIAGVSLDYGMLGIEQKTAFQRVLDKAESNGDIKCVLDDANVSYYHLA